MEDENNNRWKVALRMAASLVLILILVYSTIKLHFEIILIVFATTIFLYVLLDQTAIGAKALTSFHRIPFLGRILLYVIIVLVGMGFLQRSVAASVVIGILLVNLSSLLLKSTVNLEY